MRIQILAKPNAKRTALLKVDEQGMHITLHAKPQDGEANKELIDYIAKLFDLQKKDVILKRGAASKHKEIIVPLTAKIQKFLEKGL